MQVKRRKHKSILNEAISCFYCERVFNHETIHLNAGRKTIDHIVPLCYGGLDQKENIVIACSWCNNEKQKLSLNAFYRHVERLKITLNKSTQGFINLETIQRNIDKLKKNENYKWVKKITKN